MDKLKEHIFEIGIGAIGIALVALLVFLVILPLQSLSAKKGDISTRTAEFKRDTKKKPIPIKEVLTQIEAQKAANEAALRDGVAFYDELARPYSLYFDQMTEPPALATFEAMYRDKIDGPQGLVTKYREKFKIEVNPDQPDQTPPKVSKVEPIDDTRTGMAQREYWLIEEIFQICERLELGGLQEIEFPGRLSVDKTTYAYRRYKDAQVKIDMPFSKVENFLTELLASKTVPLLVEELSFQKTQESVAKYVPLEHSVEFQDAAEATKGDYEELVPEPNVSVTLKLLALVWEGVPEASAEEGAATE